MLFYDYHFVADYSFDSAFLVILSTVKIVILTYQAVTVYIYIHIYIYIYIYIYDRVMNDIE